MYMQLFPIYGVMLGVNYWNANMDTEHEEDLEVEHLIQIMFFIVGISFHFWRRKSY